MLQNEKTKIYDPAEDAALLLMRLGFVVLFCLLPLGSEFSRRTLFLLFPIGLILSLGSALLVMSRSMRAQAFRIRFTPVLAAALAMIFWSLLSLLWSPFWLESLGFVIKALLTGLFTWLACMALPRHTRSANLYLVSIGLALSALIPLIRFSLAVLHRQNAPVFDERAAITMTLLAWPGIAALVIRRHTIWAGILAIVTALALLLTWQFTCLVIFAAGAIVYVLSGAHQPRLARWLGLGFGLAAVLGPLLTLLLSFLASSSSHYGPYAQALQQSLLSDIPRLVTGRGLGSGPHSALGQFDGVAAHWLGFELWFDLGLLGVGAFVALSYFAFQAATQAHEILSGFLMACLTDVMLFSYIGQGYAQIWWLTLLSLVAIAFQAVANGQYRSHRPWAKMPGTATSAS